MVVLKHVTKSVLDDVFIEYMCYLIISWLNSVSGMVQ